jgi:hypothetical protein
LTEKFGWRKALAEMAIPTIFLRPKSDFCPVEGEDFAAYEARRKLVAERRQMQDQFSRMWRATEGRPPEFFELDLFGICP